MKPLGIMLVLVGVLAACASDPSDRDPCAPKPDERWGQPCWPATPTEAQLRGECPPAQDACALEGTCVAVPTLGNYQGGDWAGTTEYKCVAESSNDCKWSYACWGQGRCTLVEGFCTATTAERCEASLECTTLGKCARYATVVDGVEYGICDVPPKTP
jgi:hypothetical protein